MNEIKMITRDLIPCWYELSWWSSATRPKWGAIPAIGLSVHEDFIRNVKPITKEAPIVKSFGKEFGLCSFSGDFDHDFGFDMALKRTGYEKDFVHFLAYVPKVKKLTREKCQHCDGTGKGRIFEDKCSSCDGSGKKVIYDYQEAYALMASFTVFFCLAEFPQVETSCPYPQLITVVTGMCREMSGFSIGGSYSLSLVKWLDSLGLPIKIPAVVEAMRSAYKRIFGKERYWQDSFRAAIYNRGCLQIDCPGDACGIYTHHNAGYYIEKGLGYEFADHNVDQPGQQMTLLAGLAALNDLARNNIKTY